jgi:hypothetical protein
MISRLMAEKADAPMKEQTAGIAPGPYGRIDVFAEMTVTGSRPHDPYPVPAYEAYTFRAVDREIDAVQE